jgi:hypothetical protein
MFHGRYLHKQIPAVFGLKSIDILTTRQTIRDAEGNAIEDIFLEAYWIAELGKVYARRKNSSESFEYCTVAMVKTDKWRKGAVLVPSFRDMETKVGGPSPLYPIDISDKHDNVLECSNTLGLYPENDINLHLDGLHIPYIFQFETIHTSGSFSVRDVSNKTPTLINLYKAIIELTKYMVDVYDNDEIREFMKKGWSLR